jgi:hypothetical protein
MRVLDSEPGEPYLGVAIRNRIAIRVRIEEEIGRVRHPDAPGSDHTGGGNIQPGDDIAMGIVDAIAIGIFEDRDLVGSFHSVRRRLRNLVELGAKMVVILHDPESLRELILEILGHPHPTPGVPTDMKGLPDDRLTCDQLDLEPLPQTKLGKRFLWGGWLGAIGKSPPPFVVLDDICDLIGSGDLRVIGRSHEGDSETKKQGSKSSTSATIHRISSLPKARNLTTKKPGANQSASGFRKTLSVSA